MNETIHTSPDGALRVAVLDDHGDFIVGFIGLDWHTHGDVLVGEYAIRGVAVGSAKEAVDLFLAELLSDRIAIAVECVGGAVARAYPAWEPRTVRADVHRPDADMVELRYWSGARWTDE